jgi:hypothetical protein
LAADGHDIAVRQETIQVCWTGDFGEPRGQGLVPGRVAADANDRKTEAASVVGKRSDATISAIQLSTLGSGGYPLSNGLPGMVRRPAMRSIR